MPTFLLNPIVILSIALTLALGAVHHYRSELKLTEAQYEVYRANVKALEEQAKAHTIEVEAKNERQITDAIGSRNAALSSLRAAQAQANAGRNSVPLSPAAPAGSDQICFSQKALSSAVERYRGRIFDLVKEGDEASIDANALIQAWPK